MFGKCCIVEQCVEFSAYDVNMEARKHSKSYQKRFDCDAVVDDCQEICVDGWYIQNTFFLCDCFVQQSELYGWEQCG